MPGKTEIAVIRRTWGLSQDQFARLFMTSVRTVRRWEQGATRPSDGEQYLLQLCMGYSRVHGIEAFVTRFVGDEQRFGKVGRPSSPAVTG